MQTVLPQSFFAVMTGAINSGKSFQLASVLTAEVDGERFALPCAVLLAESSGEGTLGEVLLDPGACVVWPCSNCEQATEALVALFPYAGPLTLGAAKQAAHAALVRRNAEQAAKDPKAERPAPPPAPVAHPNDGKPLRALAVDTASTLYNGSEKQAYRMFLEQAGGKATVKPGGKGSEYNDPRESHKMAAKRCGDMLDRLNGIAMAHRGLLVLVSCHTGPAMQAQSNGEPVCVGEVPILGGPKLMAANVDVPGFSTTWDALAAKANVVWHCFETVPDFRGAATIQDINARAAEADAEGAACRGVITRKGKFPALGTVLWVKRQGGDGPLGIFAQLPAYWHPAVQVPDYITAASPTPNLGRVLAYAIVAHRKELANAQAASAAE
jgi:hypothetical protein